MTRTASSPYWLLFGARVAQARRLCDVTQDQLATELGLSRSSIANIEGGRQRCAGDTIVHLGDTLNIDPGWLLRGDPPTTLTAPPTTTELIRSRHIIDRLLRDSAVLLLDSAHRLRTFADNLPHHGTPRT